MGRKRKRKAKKPAPPKRRSVIAEQMILRRLGTGGAGGHGRPRKGRRDERRKAKQALRKGALDNPEPTASAIREYQRARAATIMGKAGVKVAARKRLAQLEEQYPGLEAAARAHVSGEGQDEGAADQSRQMALFFKAANKVLRQAFDKTRWRSKDMGEQLSLANEVYAIWAAGPGPAMGWVQQIGDPLLKSERMHLVLTMPRFSERDIMESKGNAYTLVSSLLPIAREIAKTEREAAGVEQRVREAPEMAPEFMAEIPGLERRAARKATERWRNTLDAALAELKGGSTSDQALAALVQIHLGNPVIPGIEHDRRTKKWWRQKRYDRRSRSWVIKDEGRAYKDFIAFHALGGERAAGTCPTCATLVKVVRAPGVSAADLGEQIETFLARTRVRE